MRLSSDTCGEGPDAAPCRQCVGRWLCTAVCNEARQLAEFSTKLRRSQAAFLALRPRTVETGYYLPVQATASAVDESGAVNWLRGRSPLCRIPNRGAFSKQRFRRCNH